MQMLADQMFRRLPACRCHIAQSLALISRRAQATAPAILRVITQDAAILLAHIFDPGVTNTRYKGLGRDTSCIDDTTKNAHASSVAPVGTLEALFQST